MPEADEGSTRRTEFEAEMREIVSAVQRAWAAEGLAPASGPWCLEDVFVTMAGRSTAGLHVTLLEAALEAQYALNGADSDELECLFRLLIALQPALDEFNDGFSKVAAKLEHRLRNAMACNRVAAALYHERTNTGARSLLDKTRRLIELVGAARQLLSEIREEVDARRPDAFRSGALEPTGGGPRTVVVGRMAELSASIAETTDALGDIAPRPTDRAELRAWRQKRDAARAANGNRLSRWRAKLQQK